MLLVDFSHDVRDTREKKTLIPAKRCQYRAKHLWFDPWEITIDCIIIIIIVVKHFLKP